VCQDIELALKRHFLQGWDGEVGPEFVDVLLLSSQTLPHGGWNLAGAQLDLPMVSPVYQF
jgi:hypothetical protein